MVRFDSALPALLMAVHLAAAMLRKHHAAKVFSPYVLPSFFFCATPWIWPSGHALILGAVAHAAWFAVCEFLAPTRSRAVAAQPPAGATARPAPPPAAVRSAFVTTTAIAVIDEAQDIRTFRFARPDDFSFVPGQFVPIRVRIDGAPHVRCYSISSSPEAKGYFEISVRSQGLVSTMLHATLRPGSPVVVGRPAGQFVYPAGDDRPLVLIAGGIGITPLLAMLRHAVSSDPMRTVTLLYSARTERDIAFLSELRVIAERHPQVRVAITLTRPGHSNRWRTGRVDAAMVQQYVQHPEHAIFCTCGPASMIADTQVMLRTLGVPAEQIRSERFDTALAATSLVQKEAAPAGVGARRRVTFAASQRTASVTTAQTLLEAADAQGVPIASSCRSGVCQSCRTRLHSGEVDCRSDVLDSDDRAAGYILPCVSYATTDCVLEA